MVNVYNNLTDLLLKEVCSLQRINISMELFLRELYFMVNVYNNLTDLLLKEVCSLQRIYISMELFLRELYYWQMYTIF